VADDDKQSSFEETFTELRATVEALEAGNLSLEEATKLFDRGMGLAKTCNELLTSAELQVSRLQRSFGEQMAMLHTAESTIAGDGDDDDDGEPG
jgi:exodeoxyribonuclease VII small subunit